MKKTLFPIHSTAGRIISNSQKALSLASSKKIGEVENSKVIYSPYEALYLIETNKAELIKHNKPLTKKQAEKTLSKSKDFSIKYLVFKYLRQKGYIVKTGLKFGGDFRIYEKPKQRLGVKEGAEPLAHAKYITYIINKKIILENFISKNRIAHSTAKKLLLCIVDDEQDILFYEISWINL